MLKSLALLALMGANSVLAIDCGRGKKCPKESPCCSRGWAPCRIIANPQC